MPLLLHLFDYSVPAISKNFLLGVTRLTTLPDTVDALNSLSKAGLTHTSKYFLAS